MAVMGSMTQNNVLIDLGKNMYWYFDRAYFKKAFNANHGVFIYKQMEIIFT